MAAARFMIGTQSGSVIEVTRIEPSTKLVDIGSRLDQAGAPRRGSTAHRQTAQDLGTGGRDGVGLQDMAALAGLHRFGPGLHDEKARP